MTSRLRNPTTAGRSHILYLLRLHELAVQQLERSPSYFSREFRRATVIHTERQVLFAAAMHFRTAVTSLAHLRHLLKLEEGDHE
jgi:hypothetical protein